MFVCLSICLSVCLSGMGMHCDHTVHFSADLSLWLYSPIFWTPWQQSMSTYSQPSFSSSTWKRGGVWMCTREVIYATSIGTRTDDLKWPWCLKSTSSVPHAMSVVAELLVNVLLCTTVTRAQQGICYFGWCLTMSAYRVQQKSRPLQFVVVFSATAWNIKAKIYILIWSS